MHAFKKIAAAAIAAAMTLTTGVTAAFANYADIKSSDSFYLAVNTLSNLGILTGYEDGSFKPDNTVTRAEVAAIIDRLFKLEPTDGDVPFADVPASHWAYDYINAAYSAGIVNGYSDGNFHPDDKVLYEQVITMIVRALGYEGQAYPNGYLIVAAEENIIKDSKGTVGQPATRATVARLAFNSLEVPMLVPVESTPDIKKYKEDYDKTIIKGLGVEKLDVVVAETYFGEAINGNYDPDNRTVVLRPKGNGQTYRGKPFEESSADSIECQEGGTSAGSMLGYSCVAYVGVDEQTGRNVIYSIGYSGRDFYYILTKDRFADDNDLDKTKATFSKERGRVYFRRDDDDSDRLIYVNPDTDGIAIYENYADTTSRYEETVEKDGDVNTVIPGDVYKGLLGGDDSLGWFIDTDRDYDINSVIIARPSKKCVVNSVKVSGGVYTFECEGSGIADYDPKNSDQVKLFIKNGNYVDPSEIAAGETVIVIGDEQDGNFVIYLVSYDEFDNV